MDDLHLTYIVPVYNTEAYVLRCLQSLVSQDIPEDNYEIIIVDDGSTDGSRDVIDAFAREHRQVRVLSQDNAGISVARNLAIDNARGRYIQFVDSDDFLGQHVMGPLLRRALDLNVDALVFNYTPVAVDGQDIPSSREDFAPSSGVMTGVEYLDCHVMTPYIWRFLVRRDFLEQGPWRFNPSLIVCEDGALIAQILLYSSRVAHDEAAPYRYTRRDDSAMHNQDVQHLRRRLFSQVDAAASINETIRQYETQSSRKSPASVAGLMNVYLYFAMTKAFDTGLVDNVLEHIRQSGLYPFPCVGPESNYYGYKWKFIHALMMRPSLWKLMSKIYRLIK
jgi:glycosyltransferase involved in cell wall biosynthesis